MSSVIGTGQSTGMGDVLLLTAICKHVKDCTVELLPKLKKFSRFFDGISEKVVYTETPVDLINKGDDHYAKCKLRGLGIYDVCYLPEIKISDSEINEGLSLISEYKNPVVFVPNTSLKFKEVREVKAENWLPVLDNLKAKGHDILQFGVNENFTNFKQTIKLLDLPIEKLILYYSAIKKYYGVETGDKHLMLACGGSINVYRSKKYKDHHRWIYNVREETIAYS